MAKTKKKASAQKEPKPKNCKNLFQKRQMQIISKATKLFMKKGYAQTSMRDISRATGIDISNLYYFIKNKEEILFLVFNMLHRPELELFEKKAIMSIDNPIEQLKAVIHGLINSGYSYDNEILLLYRESKSLPKRLLKDILKKESLVVSQIEDILKKGKARKVFQVEDTSLTANLIAYELSLYPLRKWNMKKYTKKELAGLMEKSIMKMVTK
ncbi:MAG TPA: TetR/AcrR family transcriptional regulator [Deltaproteobacteria bacterium]|nr:TetR/AcrR family transcriptional regulator [Deltaproteobacteria bacterium]